MNVVITMAGRGTRFRDAGHDRPKYEIEARGRALFDWAVDSLRPFFDEAAFVFIGRREPSCADYVRTACARLGIERFDILEIDGDTPGQAATARLVEPCLDNVDEPFLVYNIDTRVDPRAWSPDAVHGAGWIPCFPGHGDHWSFARLDDDGFVCEVREKTRISDHATVGLYGFESFRLFAEAYDDAYAGEGAAAPEAGERYIAPLYNRLIAAGRDVTIHHLPFDTVVPLGTPAEVAAFEAAEGHAERSRP